MPALIGVFVGLLCLCPLATDVLGVPRIAYWALSCVVLAAGLHGVWRPDLKRRIVTSLAAMLVFSAASYAALQQPKAAAIPVIALLPFTLLLGYPLGTLRRLTEAMSGTLLVLLVGAWVGLAYFQAGGSPILSFEQYDGRISELYLSTLSVTVLDQGYMRPSSLFDEPGTLSFITVCVACLRVALGLRTGRTVALMVLGLVTGSIAHVICVVSMLLHAASVSGIWRRIQPTKLLLALVVSVPAGWFVYAQLIAPRLVETASGGIEADTRTPLVLRSLLLLDQASPLSGLDQGLCYFDSVTCVSTYGIFLESPLGPYLALGGPASLPYYLFLLMLLVLAGMQRKMAFIHLTVLAIFLQRPYVLNLGYATLAGLYLATILELRRRRLAPTADARRRRQRRRKRPSQISVSADSAPLTPPLPTMLFIVSTFIRCDDQLRELQQNLSEWQSRRPITWLVSSPDTAVATALGELDWCRVMIRGDRGYAEGWNNALDMLPTQAESGADRVMFLGAGDGLEALPEFAALDARTVYCGATRRTDLEGRQIQLSLPAVRPDRFWLRIGAWTPACLFPRAAFDQFRLQVDLRVGADVAVFFRARELGFRFVTSPELRVAMKTGGLSGDPRRGLQDYLRVAQSFGIPFPLLQAGHALRWLRARSTFR